jgi:hypothetical protein
MPRIAVCARFTSDRTGDAGGIHDRAVQATGASFSFADHIAGVLNKSSAQGNKSARNWHSLWGVAAHEAWAGVGQGCQLTNRLSVWRVRREGVLVRPVGRNSANNLMMMRKLSMIVGAVCLATSPSLVSAATVVLFPAQDTSIYSETDNSNGAGGLFAGQTVSQNLRRALMRFDVSGIPAGAVITAASLTVTQTKIGPSAAATFELRPLAAAWGEGVASGSGVGAPPNAGDATWNYRFYGGSLWSTSGGNFGGVSASTPIGTDNMAYLFSSQSLVANVQSWVQAPASNFGWILKAANETPGVTTAREFGSRETGGNAVPRLSVTYTLDPVPEPATLLVLAGACAFLGMRRSRN